MIFGGLASRVIVPEILDGLPPEDPEARRSRKDLQFLDWFLGNSAWIEKRLRTSCLESHSVVELGAGEGHLSRRLARVVDDVTGLDFAPSPLDPPEGLRWISGDFFESLPACSAMAVVGALILHHFDEPGLKKLGALLGHRHLMLFVEPLRTQTSLGLCMPLLPFVGRVTRHDMRASIRAGFLPGELGPLLGLGRAWTISETVDWRGTLRFKAWRE
ncbi:MAG: class I SAM-dependent methyltransferase [Terrimicrobiaceae bacterium]